MARFDYKYAICEMANEVEGTLMCAREEEREGWGNPAALRERASNLSNYAAWLARSYRPKGRTKKQATVQ